MPQHAPTSASGETQWVNVSELLLDEDNPRFGDLERNAEQSHIVDLIIEKFGIEDVISSLAMNGFFAAEPLVCLRKNGKLIVKEGNRRLCACIILTGDPRSVRQSNLKDRMVKIWQSNGKPKIEPVPVLIFDDEGPEAKAMLSYLGVRHIASAQPWDSYAKAAWVAKVTDETGMDISKITEMIGDQHSTVIRLLEGYRFITQLKDNGIFRPSNSQRRGRGSVSEYPFSWVYTILGFKAARAYCGLSESIDVKKNPIPNDKLENAGALVTAMFGDRTIGRSSAVEDSRQLSSLASAFADSEKIALLKTGKDLQTVLEITKPIEIKLSENLRQVRDILSDLLSSTTQSKPTIEIAKENLEPSMNVRALSVQLAKQLKEIIDAEFERFDG